MLHQGRRALLLDTLIDARLGAPVTRLVQELITRRYLRALRNSSG